MIPKIYLTICILIFINHSVHSQDVILSYPQDIPQAVFAAETISESLKDRGLQIKIQSASKKDGSTYNLSLILLENKKSVRGHGFKLPTTLKKEGYSLQVNGNEIGVIGFDAAGLMYGGLELAEQISVYGINSIKPGEENPYMAMRGTKFNIPLDVRTPSYSDLCDAGQKNIPEMWSMDFWKDYIDHLAKYRFNFISLWNLHPFPSMVKVDKYPDIALDDVMRSAGDLKEDYPLEGVDLDAPEVMDTLEVIAKMTIEEKISFWREVMKYGKYRNVDFYIITWNIFDYGIENKYGITDNFRNETTKNYFKKSVEAMILTYPDLKGIGITTGENMYGASFEEKEDWAFDTYAQGMIDGLKKFPGRKMTFVHRQHYARALEIADKFKPLIDHPDIEFIYSFKYAKAHVYSSTEQPFHENFVQEIKSKGDLKTIWTLRNDDIYYFRWGAPNFVRTFMKNIPYDVSMGYYYGSDQYIWGREFLDKYPQSPRQIEIDKHWYHWMIWGRLGYNPELENERFIAIIQQKFPEIDGKLLFNAWQIASMVYPLTTGFHWGALDFQWYIEGCQSRDLLERTPYRYNHINDFITLTPHPSSGNISIPDYVDKIVNKRPIEGNTPFYVAGKLHQNAHNALSAINKIGQVRDQELMKIIEDIRSMAYLGMFYSYKIHAATNLHFFRETGTISYRDTAIKNLKASISYFKKYASNAMKISHNPLWTNRVGYVDWKKTMDWALHDLKIIGTDLILDPDDLLDCEIIRDAEDASMDHGIIKKIIKDCSGGGYIVEGSNIEWTFTLPESGFYNLKFRYAIRWGSGSNVGLIINGKKVDPFYFWNTGDPSNWTVDEQVYYFNQGENTIGIDFTNRVNIDQLGLDKIALILNE
jgi:hypothetical protein